MATLIKLESLVSTLHLYDEGESVTAALRREAEAQHDPSLMMSLEEFQHGIAAMRGR